MFPESFLKTGRLARLPHNIRPTHFQVFGERGSATNLVRKLIEKNLDVIRTESLGWKHGAPHMVAIPKDFLIIGVVRNAESWALSMHKRPWHLAPECQAYDFSTFLRSPWQGIVDRPTDFEEIYGELEGKTEGLELQYDRHPITGQRFANLFDLRRVKMACLLGMLNRSCNMVLLRAEEVQADPEGFVTWMSETLKLDWKPPQFKPVKRRLGNLHKLSVSADTRGPTPKVMSAEDRAYMISALDMSFERALGYDYPIKG